jgi:S-adenosylmethionine:tRNA ribosyltransferase-isomerase
LAPVGVGGRLWIARLELPGGVDLDGFLTAYGRPIRYGYTAGAWPLSAYQTVYATEPGSAEMVSAGRPFTESLLVRLIAAGVIVAPIVLHAGVSSPESGEAPLPERYQVPEATANLVAGVRRSGKRVIAVGTTTVRALESAACAGGEVRAAGGWTDLVLGPARRSSVVTGLVTGLHAPEASHLLLLEAVAGPVLVAAAYQSAASRGYLWHEFGDTMLFLPG